LRAGPQAGFNLVKRMLAVGVSDQQISRGLQQRQKREQDKEQSASKPAESKFQR
jgi:hypothetical protein